MPTYRTPGVYVEEIAVFPPSVAPVATAIPAFIGYTQKAEDQRGDSLVKKAIRITSLLEYETLFGKSPPQKMEIAVTKRSDDKGKPLGIDVAWKDKAPTEPDWYLHYAMQLYFANGGGPCYIYATALQTDSAGTATAVKVDDFTAAITALEEKDEPTLLVFPDAVKLNDDSQYGDVVKAALANCNKTQDRFTIADVRKAVADGNHGNSEVDENFRAKVGTAFLKYGAAYFPYLNTNLPFATDDRELTCTLTPEPESEPKKPTLADLKTADTATYAAVRAFVDQTFVTLPPSGAIAGVYAQVDRTRGVWKAPANIGLSRVIAPAINVTNDLQDALNIDPNTGKSVNAIRAFFGKGTLVWGARTLAGNDNEWRYVNVRRFANFVEESVRKAIGTFVFEPNDANTWVKVRSMIENFLINQWRDGALMGAKPEQAFQVKVGLGQTMTADDVLNGYLIVEILLAIVRPAEFIVLRFMQKMPEA